MIFKTFDPTDVVAGRVQPVSTGMWASGEPTWTQFYTSSLQAKYTGSDAYAPLNGLYYLNVYDEPTSSLTSEVYFSVVYGHLAGSGSSDFDLNLNTGSLIEPTKAVYGQYRNMLLVPGDEKFTFASGSIQSQTEVDSDDIYAINFRSDKLKDRLDPGQFELTLHGSNGTFTFIDDSRENTSVLTATGGKRFNVISGSISAGADVSGELYRGIGSMYPDLGVVVLNPRVISAIVGNTPIGSLDTPTGPQTDYALMHRRLFSSISPDGTGLIKARVTEYIPSQHYFVRIKNQEFNYSNNPTFVISAQENSATAGMLRFADFSTDPKVYVTTIGLYNENNDLVAVAKLSQPILKDFSSEILVRIRLDW